MNNHGFYELKPINVKSKDRFPAGSEVRECFVIQDLTSEGDEQWRQIGTYLEDRKDHLDMYRKQLDL